MVSGPRANGLSIDTDKTTTKTNNQTKTMKLTNPKNGEEFISAFDSHSDAREALSRRIDADEFKDNDLKFAESIYTSTEKAGGQSPGRLFYLHRLATTPPKKQAARPLAKVDMSGLVTMMQSAKENGLKFPSLTLTTTNGLEVKLAIAGDKSRYTGAVMASSGQFRGGKYYGRVMPEGDFYAGVDFTPEVGKLLSDMARDPKGTATAQGHLTGRCCFCRKALDDEKSTALGYGPTCAKKFGLIYSKKAAAEKTQFGTSRKVARSAPPAAKPQQVTRRIIRRIIDEA